MNQCTKPKNEGKMLRATTFICYCKVGRAITLWGAIEKDHIAIAILKKLALWLE